MFLVGRALDKCSNGAKKIPPPEGKGGFITESKDKQQLEIN